MELCDVDGWIGTDGGVIGGMTMTTIAASVLGDGEGDGCKGSKTKEEVESKFLSGGEWDCADGTPPPGADHLLLHLPLLLPHHEDAALEIPGETCSDAHETTSGQVWSQTHQTYHCWDLRRSPMDLDLTVDFVEQIQIVVVARLESVR